MDDGKVFVNFFTFWMNKKSQNNGWMKNIHVTLEVFSMNEKTFSFSTSSTSSG